MKKFIDVKSVQQDSGDDIPHIYKYTNISQSPVSQVRRGETCLNTVAANDMQISEELDDRCGVGPGLLL